MIDWMLAGVLMAVLMAELVDAWALRHLTGRCLAIHPRSPAERRVVRWYAEGFDHSRAVASWLTVACLILTVVALGAAVHPLLTVSALVLAACAHGERCLSIALKRRFRRACY